jgi:uncharacterized protein (DUF983 family)
MLKNEIFNFYVLYEGSQFLSIPFNIWFNLRVKKTQFVMKRKSPNLMLNIVGQKCPSCRTGMLFKHCVYCSGFSQMHEKCSNCGQRYSLEPGFFDGAMYVSYALQVAIFVSVVVAYEVLYPTADVIWYFGTVVVLALALFPVTFRLSRSIWVHFFIKYNRETVAANNTDQS